MKKYNVQISYYKYSTGMPKKYIKSVRVDATSENDAKESALLEFNKKHEFDAFQKSIQYIERYFEPR